MMKALTNNWRGLAILGMGLLTVVLASTILHVCADEGHFVKTASGTEIHMACTWTKRAVIGVGGLTAVIGLIMLFANQAARALSFAGAAGGALMLAIPLKLIPGCANAMMTCNQSFKPGVYILGSVLMLIGLVGTLKLARGEGARLAA
ncbi:MAG: hypothetical protein K0R39_4871 [Symbiobacteriaceae bacterium]|nr:hypothetical protein [Symbiobacteriaceae bacterium]